MTTQHSCQSPPRHTHVQVCFNAHIFLIVLLSKSCRVRSILLPNAAILHTQTLKCLWAASIQLPSKPCPCAYALCSEWWLWSVVFLDQDVRQCTAANNWWSCSSTIGQDLWRRITHGSCTVGTHLKVFVWKVSCSQTICTHMMFTTKRLTERYNCSCRTSKS